MRTIKKSQSRFLAIVGMVAMMLIGMIELSRTVSAGDDIKTSPVQESSEKANDAKGTEVAIFAGGCFWCVESDFDKVPGVLETISGYTGGHTKNPTYKEVSYKNTGHYEAVKITYDPKVISYAKLLHSFWRSVDPTDPSGQFCDKGASYRTAIFTSTPEQFNLATDSKDKEQNEGKLKGRIVTPVIKATQFYPAEDYHQNYYQTNPVRYTYYRYGCGRDKRIKELWGEEAHSGQSKLTH